MQYALGLVKADRARGAALPMEDYQHGSRGGGLEKLAEKKMDNLRGKIELKWAVS